MLTGIGKLHLGAAWVGQALVKGHPVMLEHVQNQSREYYWFEVKGRPTGLRPLLVVASAPLHLKPHSELSTFMLPSGPIAALMLPGC